jgi:hypothetical protein
MQRLPLLLQAKMLSPASLTAAPHHSLKSLQESRSCCTLVSHTHLLTALTAPTTLSADRAAVLRQPVLLRVPC